jgi:hypothetical protein
VRPAAFAGLFRSVLADVTTQLGGSGSGSGALITLRRSGLALGVAMFRSLYLALARTVTRTPSLRSGTCRWANTETRRLKQLADSRDDFVAVQLDVGHELVVRQTWHAVLEVEPGGAKGAEISRDLPRDGIG